MVKYKLRGEFVFRDKLLGFAVSSDVDCSLVPLIIAILEIVID